MYGTWNRKKSTFISCLYLCNFSTSDMLVCLLGYINVNKRKVPSPEVWHIPPGTSSDDIERGGD
jgi:hypothetical protein